MRKRIFGVEKFKGLLLAGTLAPALQFLTSFLGGIISGHWFGEDALSGVCLLSPVFSLLVFVSGLFGVGMGVSYSREMGRCNVRKAHEIFSSGLVAVVAVGLAMTAAMALARPLFFAFLNPAPEVAVHAVGYWRWFVPVAFLEPLATYLLNASYADGDSHLCIVSYAAQFVANIAVTLIALACGVGTSGCAMGAAAGFLAAVAVLSLHFARKTNSFRLVASFRLSHLKSIVVASFGDASSLLCDALFFLTLSKFVLHRFGSDPLPALSVVIATFSVLEVTGGVGAAVQPIATVYAGERNTRAIRRVMRSALSVSVAEGIAASLFVALFPNLVAAAVGITDAPSVAMTSTALRLVAVGLCCSAVANLLNGYYIVIGREALAVGVTFFLWLAMPAASAFAGSLTGRIEGVWAGLGLGPVVGMGLFALWMRRRHGRGAFPLALERDRDERIAMYDLELEPGEVTNAAHSIARTLSTRGVDRARSLRAELLTEEVLMAVRDRNAPRRVLAEVTLDLNDEMTLTMRDDGEIFDITDADQRISSLRTYLVASVMQSHRERMNLVTTGVNRNVFRFGKIAGAANNCQTTTTAKK